MSGQPILVCGFLGAGKSTLVARLTDQGLPSEEVDGLLAPGAIAPGETRRVIAVVDCANAARLIEDPLIGSLLRRQIEAATLVALSRGDLLDPTPIREVVQTIGDCQTFNAPHGVLPEDALQGLEQREMATSLPKDNLKDAFGTWHYGGAASFGFEQAERLIANRPDGVERMEGVIRTDTGGLEVQVAGRMRQTQAVALPRQTELSVRWNLSATPQKRIDLWFAEAVADNGHKRGLFGYR